MEGINSSWGGNVYLSICGFITESRCILILYVRYSVLVDKAWRQLCIGEVHVVGPPGAAESKSRRNEKVR